MISGNDSMGRRVGSQTLKREKEPDLAWNSAANIRAFDFAARLREKQGETDWVFFVWVEFPPTAI